MIFVRIPSISSEKYGRLFIKIFKIIQNALKMLWNVIRDLKIVQTVYFYEPIAVRTGHVLHFQNSLPPRHVLAVSSRREFSP